MVFLFFYFYFILKIKKSNPFTKTLAPIVVGEENVQLTLRSVHVAFQDFIFKIKRN